MREFTIGRKFQDHQNQLSSFYRDTKSLTLHQFMLFTFTLSRRQNLDGLFSFMIEIDWFTNRMYSIEVNEWGTDCWQ